MRYVIKVWRAVKAEQIEIQKDMRPGCPGAFGRVGSTCSQRPDHIVTYTRNESGYPLTGNQTVTFACYRHVHGVLIHAVSIGQFATVSKYEGI